MPSDKRIAGYLSDDDYKLFNIAVKKYGGEKSELLREIVHAWLFANKLHFKK